MSTKGTSRVMAAIGASRVLGLVREIGTGPQDPKRRYFSTAAP